MVTQAERDRLGGWAVMLDPDQNIDRRTCKRTVPMEVLSLGAPRTGTLSMRNALEMLGYAQPYHYASVFANCKDSDMWLDAFDAKFNPQSKKKPFGRKEFDQLLGHCGAITDVPAIIFWRELMEAYPEAKIVLVDRNQQSWLASIERVTIGVLNPMGRYVLRFMNPSYAGRIHGLSLTWMRYWFGVKGSMSVERVMSRATDTYNSHYMEIRKTVPPSKLLEYKLGSDWKPLCNFLGKDIPYVPFPNVNDAATLELVIGTFLRKALVASLTNLAIGLVVCATVYFTIKWRL